MGIIYLPTSFKFQLHRLISNGDLLSDRNRWKHTHTPTNTHTHTDSQTHTQTNTQTKSDTLPIWDIGSSNKVLYNKTKLLSILRTQTIMKHKKIHLDKCFYNKNHKATCFEILIPDIRVSFKLQIRHLTSNRMCPLYVYKDDDLL